MSPPGCRRAVHYLWALAQLLSQAFPSPVNSGALHLLFTPPRHPYCPSTPQSNPNPSVQPVDSMIYHSDHLTLLRTASLRPFFHRGKSTLCRVFLDPSPPHLLPRLPTASAYQKAGYREGTIAFGAGQVLHVAHLAPGNKTTVAACLMPQKMPPPPPHSKWPLISVLGFNPDLDLHHLRLWGPRPMQCLGHASGAQLLLKYCTLHVSIAHTSYG